MKFAKLILICIVAAGCTHTQVNVSSNTSAASASPSAGTSVSGGSVGVQVHSNALAALLVMGMFLAAATKVPAEPASAMDPKRRVIEQDCSRPVDLSVTLKCR